MKRILAMALTLILFISTVLPVNVSATAPSTPSSTISPLPFEEFTTSQNENARYGERTESTILATESKTFTVKPIGQPPEGYCIPGGGAVHIIKDTGTPSTFSAGLSWKHFSFSITPGTVSNGPSVGAISVNIPANNNHYLVYGSLKYNFYYVRVDEYQYSELVNTYYRTTYRLMAEDWYPVKVS